MGNSIAAIDLDKENILYIWNIYKYFLKNTDREKIFKKAVMINEMKHG